MNIYILKVPDIVCTILQVLINKGNYTLLSIRNLDVAETGDEQRKVKAKTS
jgi:hypothetical protein